MSLSVVLATFNEEKNLKNCLKAVKNIASEIVIVDGQSTDKTVDIARAFKARIFIKPNPPIFHINKQIALKKAKYAWILQLDADEVVDSELKQSIKKVLTTNPPTCGFYLKRKNMFLKTWLKKGGQYPDPVIRLVKKGKAYFPQKSVHEQIAVNGPVDTLKGHLIHYTAPTFTRYLVNSNRYTSLTANQFKKQQLKLNLVNWFKYFLVKPLSTFIKLYFRHLGILDRFPGFVFAFFSALHWPTAFIKYWQLKKIK